MVIVSAWYTSIDSIRPDALAAERSSPFPCETAIDRALGLHTMTTGTPTVSSPVTFAMRVMPMIGARRSPRSRVSSGGSVRWVPARNALRAPAPVTDSPVSDVLVGLPLARRTRSAKENDARGDLEVQFVPQYILDARWQPGKFPMARLVKLAVYVLGDILLQLHFDRLIGIISHEKEPAIRPTDE